MDYWSKSPESRDQLVLFPTCLDDVIPLDHPVRLLDEVLSRLDWSAFESTYHGSRGQPPIHPRIVASVLLYGLLTRVRSSRSLEEALEVRLDFRWLAEGRSIDHTTLSEFRRTQSAALKKLFVDVGLVARHLGLLPLERLAYDGTRLRSNNRNRGSRTPAELREWRTELARHYDQQCANQDQADLQEQGQTKGSSSFRLPPNKDETRRRLAQVDSALAELERVQENHETVPKRIPLTDPQSRISPNKDGGFAPNYTPLATVDCAHGLIVACDVISMTDEEHFLQSQIEQVQENYGLSSPPPEMLADGAMPTRANLQTLDQMGVTLYSPIAAHPADQNPAVRPDPTQPVAENQIDQLPTSLTKAPGGKQQARFSKEAFVYDASRDCYWCPQGQSLARERTMTKPRATGPVVEMNYRTSTESCQECPLRKRCLKDKTSYRRVVRYESDPLVEQLAQRMSTAEGKAKYERRRHVAERPFAVIKHQFGVRQFLLRRLNHVRTEWRWMVIAFNLSRLISLWPTRAGPQVDVALQGCPG